MMSQASQMRSMSERVHSTSSLMRALMYVSLRPICLLKALPVRRRTPIPALIPRLICLPKSLTSIFFLPILFTIHASAFKPV